MSNIAHNFQEYNENKHQLPTNSNSKLAF